MSPTTTTLLLRLLSCMLLNAKKPRLPVKMKMGCFSATCSSFPRDWRCLAVKDQMNLLTQFIPGFPIISGNRNCSLLCSWGGFEYNRFINTVLITRVLWWLVYRLTWLEMNYLHVISKVYEMCLQIAHDKPEEKSNLIPDAFSSLPLWFWHGLLSNLRSHKWIIFTASLPLLSHPGPCVG